MIFRNIEDEKDIFMKFMIFRNIMTSWPTHDLETPKNRVS